MAITPHLRGTELGLQVGSLILSLFFPLGKRFIPNIAAGCSLPARPSTGGSLFSNRPRCPPLALAAEKKLTRIFRAGAVTKRRSCLRMQGLRPRALQSYALRYVEKPDEV